MVDLEKIKKIIIKGDFEESIDKLNIILSLDNKNIDGYIVPKNDEFFSEYSLPNRLKLISNFSGSAGLAIILKNKNLLFVDGRYTLQAHIECGSDFKIFEIPKIKPKLLSTTPRPDHVTALLMALLMLIITKRVLQKES